jgi:predicted cupin superfamily sugar epimerase
MDEINELFNDLSPTDKAEFFKEHKSQFQSYLNAERREYRRIYYQIKRETDKKFHDNQKKQQREYHARKRAEAKK